MHGFRSLQHKILQCEPQKCSCRSNLLTSKGAACFRINHVTTTFQLFHTQDSAAPGSAASPEVCRRCPSSPRQPVHSRASVEASVAHVEKQTRELRVISAESNIAEQTQVCSSWPEILRTNCALVSEPPVTKE